jgi:ABC-type sugar transport system substrate-binding protein
MRITTPNLRALLVLGLAVAGLGAAGCGSDDNNSSSDAASKPASSTPAETTTSAAAETSNATATFPDYDKLAPPNFKEPTEQFHIAALIADTSLPLQKSMVQGWKDSAAKHNVKLDVYDAGGFGNVARQVGQMETAIGTNPDAIIILPTSPVSLNAPIAQAAAKNIPVIGQLIPPTSKKMTFSLAELLDKDGEVMVDEVAKRVGSKGKVMIVNGGAGGAPDVYATQGFKKGLKKYPDMEVVLEKHLATFNPADSQQTVESALVRNPDIVAVISNSTTVAQGALAATKQAGKKIVVSGIGPDTAQQIKFLRDGDLAIAIAPPFYKVSDLLIQWAIATKGGAKPPAPIMPIDSMVLTTENIDEALSTGRFFDSLSPAAVGCGEGQKAEC